MSFFFQLIFKFTRTHDSPIFVKIAAASDFLIFCKIRFPSSKNVFLHLCVQRKLSVIIIIRRYYCWYPFSILGQRRGQSDRFHLLFSLDFSVFETQYSGSITTIAVHTQFTQRWYHQNKNSLKTKMKMKMKNNWQNHYQKVPKEWAGFAFLLK